MDMPDTKQGDYWTGSLCDRVLTHVKRLEIDQAEELLQKVDSIGGSFFNLNFLNALCCFARGNIAAACERLQAELQAFPDNGSAMEWLNYLTPMQAAETARQLNSLAAQIMSLWQAGQKAEAISGAESLVRACPACPGLRVLLAQFLLAENNFAGALACLEEESRIAQLSPETAAVLEQLKSLAAGSRSKS